MALTKSGMRKQVIENLSQVAPPGEQFVACVHGITGPSPWLDGLFGGIGAMIMQAIRKYYFVTLTNTSIVINRAGRVANRPKEVVAAIPLASGAVTDVQLNPLWSKLYIQFPGQSKPTKINIHRIWRSDLEQISAAAAAFTAVPGQPAGPAGQPTAQV